MVKKLNWVWNNLQDQDPWNYFEGAITFPIYLRLQNVEWHTSSLSFKSSRPLQSSTSPSSSGAGRHQHGFHPVLSFDSRSMSQLLSDKTTSSFFQKEFPIFYKNKFQKQNNANKFFYRSAGRPSTARSGTTKWGRAGGQLYYRLHREVPNQPKHLRVLLPVHQEHLQTSQVSFRKERSWFRQSLLFDSEWCGALLFYMTLELWLRRVIYISGHSLIRIIRRMKTIYAPKMVPFSTFFNIF